jgi:hypothetical protein
MRKWVMPVIACLLALACKNSTGKVHSMQPLTDTSIQNEVKKLYAKKSKPGKSEWKIDTVKVIQVYNTADAARSAAKVMVKGTHTFLADSTAKPQFILVNETRAVKMEWQNGNWICIDTY